MAANFTDRELDVMAVLWDAGPSTTGEVRERLAAQGVELAYNSVLTFLRILEEKGFVGHAEEGRAHRYHALVTRREAGATAVDRLLDKMFGGSAGWLMTHLVRERHLDDAEIERLRRLLDERAEERHGTAAPRRNRKPRRGGA